MKLLIGISKYQGEPDEIDEENGELYDLPAVKQDIKNMEELWKDHFKFKFIKPGKIYLFI